MREYRIIIEHTNDAQCVKCRILKVEHLEERNRVKMNKLLFNRSS